MTYTCVKAHKLQQARKQVVTSLFTSYQVVSTRLHTVMIGQYYYYQFCFFFIFLTILFQQVCISQFLGQLCNKSDIPVKLAASCKQLDGSLTHLLHVLRFLREQIGKQVNRYISRQAARWSEGRHNKYLRFVGNQAFLPFPWMFLVVCSTSRKK